MRIFLIITCFILLVSNSNEIQAQCPAPNPNSANLPCGPGTITLTAMTSTPNLAHRWYYTLEGGSPITAGFSQNNNPYYTVSNLVVTASVTTTYYVSTYNSSANCESKPRTPITLTVNTVPVANITTNGVPTNVCSLDNSFLLTATAGTSYQWKLNGSNIPVYSQTYHPTVSGNYSVVIGNSCGSQLAGPVPVTIVSPANLTVSLSGDATICAGNTAYYTATVPDELRSLVSYQWYIGSSAVGSNSSTFSTSSLTDGSTVKCIATLINGACATPSSVSSNVISVTVNSVPSTPYSGNNVSDCGPKTLNLTTVNTSGTGITHHWYGSPYGSDEISGIQTNYSGGTFTSSLSQYFASTTKYYVSATNSCGSSARTEVTATVNPDPNSLTLTPSGPANFCEGSAFTLTAGGGSNYKWYLNSTSNPVLSSATTYTPTQSGTYYLVGTNSCSRNQTLSMSVTVNPRPTAPIVTQPYIIAYNTTGTLSATGAGTNESYHWYTTLIGGTALSSNITPALTTATSYYVAKYNTLTNCESGSRVTYTITVNRYPTLNAGIDQIIDLPNNLVTLTGTASDPDGTIKSYLWSQVSGPSSVTIPNNTNTSVTISGLVAGAYVFRLTVMDNYDYTSTDDISVTVNALPVGYNQNFIRTTVVLEKGKTDLPQLSGLTVDQKSISITYFDGLGRPMQQVNWQGTPLKKDIVQPIGYDEFGREVKKYLPYASSDDDASYKLSPLTDQALFYTGTMGFAANDSAYSRTLFEPSPLNRVMQQGAPGAAWQPSAGHALGLAYLTNTASEVKQWSVSSTNQLVLRSTNSGNYDANVLYVNQTKDENGSRTKEYKDKEGRVVLKKSYMEGDLLETYYVYDDFGLLRYVIPPKAVKAINVTTLGPTNTYVRQLCYYYSYDERNRMVLKQLPGADSVLMVYDARDRLVATQDGNQRAAGKWTFTKYDLLNRPSINGIFKPAQTTRVALQSAINTYYNTVGKQWFTERMKASTITYPTGYDLGKSYPEGLAENDVLSVTYYDSYDSIPGSKSFSAVADLGVTEKNNKVKGQVTATRSRVLDGNNSWITTTNYYDDKYRVIQSVKTNYIGGMDRMTTRYDFVGKVKQTRLVHAGQAGKTIDKTFEYDHAGRLVKIFHSIDSATPVLMSYMKYNELGQLTDKKLHVSDQVNDTYVQSIDYRYNIRGWLKSINNPGLTNDNGSTNDDNTDKFGMKLMYENLNQ